MRILSLPRITKSVFTVAGVLLLAQARADGNADGVSPYGDGFAPDVVSVDITGNGVYPDFEGDGPPFLDDYNNSSTTAVDVAPDLSRRAAADFYLRVMPLGASITQGQQSTDANGYRKWIRSQLRYKGWNVNMVGSKQDGDMADSDNEGHPGFTIQQVNSSWDSSKWMKPNLVLLNVGLNDCTAGTSVAASKAAYKSLLENIYRSDPGVTVVVSTLLLNTNTALLPCLSGLSQEIANLVNDFSGSRIVLADIRSAMSLSDVGADGTHPNDQGYKLFAGVWWSAISRIESLIQAPDASADIDDSKEDGGNTCRKVAGNAGAPVQVQLGSGHDDGNYVHSSTGHGALSTAQINKNSDPKSITDAIPSHIFFANLVVGDPNADRKAALDDWVRVFHDTSGKNTYWFRQNLAGGRFGEGKTFDVDMDCDSGPHYAFADFNNDGYDDFFCIKQNSVWASINQKDNPPTFKSIGQIIGNLDGYGSEDVRIADIDGDGRADFCLLKTDGTVICSRNGGTSDTTPQWQGFSTATGIRGTVFDKTANAKSGIILADLNGDFKADYMFVNDFGNVHTWINNRGWNRGIVPDWRDAGVTHLGQTDTGIQGNIKFGRIYGSGRADYIYLKEQDDHYDVLVWENKGSGGTKRKADGNFYCDMFGTGSDDYVWIYMDGHSDEVDINVHQPPIWGHSVKLTLSVPGPRVGIHLADWTGNGRCDVLVQDKTTGTLTLHENNYDPAAQTLTFGSGQQVTPGTCSEGWGVGIFDRGMRLADIDGDGRADPLCIEKNGRITAWLNKASGLVNVNQIKFSEGWDRANIRFADVEASGRADLLHVDKYTGAVTVFKNNGQRTSGSSSFSWTNRGVLYSPIDRGETMHFLNLGGKGRADLLHVLPLTNRAWVYYNRCGTSGGDDGAITDPGLPIPPDNGNTGPITITTGGTTITIAPIQTSNVQTLTGPDGSTTVLTLPPGSTITGVETITTGGTTLTVGPVTTLPPATITSTMTTVPSGVSLEDFTASRISTNIWITTTGSDSSTTIVPVILPCPTCEPVIVWDLPEIPNVKFDWPSIPRLPTFHLPCIKIFGIRISGECPSPSGPPPVNDGPPREPEPFHEPVPGPEPDDPSTCRTATSTDCYTRSDSAVCSTYVGCACQTKTVTDEWVSCDDRTCSTTRTQEVTGCFVSASKTTGGSYCPTPQATDPTNYEDGEDGGADSDPNIGVTVTKTYPPTAIVGGTPYPMPSGGTIIIGGSTLVAPTGTAASTTTVGGGTVVTLIPSRTGASISITRTDMTVVPPSTTLTPPWSTPRTTPTTRTTPTPTPTPTPTSTPPDEPPSGPTFAYCVGQTDIPSGQFLTYNIALYPQNDRCNGVFLRDATIGTPESICKVPREEARFDWCGGDKNGVFRDSGPQFFDEDSCGFQIEIDGELYTPEKLDPADSKNACAGTCQTSSIAGFFLYQLPGSCQ